METIEQVEMFNPAALSAGEKNDFVFRLLSNKSNWTEDIVTGLMEKAHVCPKQSLDVCHKMACKFLWILNNSVRLNKPNENWIPTQSCVDLTTTGAALTAEEKKMSVDEVRQLWATDDVKARRKNTKKIRHFKRCLQCNIRFLPKRSNADFHDPKCYRRYLRANPQTAIPAPVC